MEYTTRQIQDMIRQEARRQGVDPALALAVAQTESAFEWWQIGDKGQAVGVYQLHPAAAQEVGLSPQDRYDVPRNIRGGIAYLKNRIAREGNEDRGISAYNQGVGLRDGQLSNPTYVRMVRQYQRQHQQHPALFSRVARAVSPGRAEAADLPTLPPGAARTPLPDLPDRPPAALAPAPQTPTLLHRLGQAAETALEQVPIAGPVYGLVKPVLQAQYGPQFEALPRAGAAAGISAGGTATGARIGGLLGTPFGPPGVAIGTGLGAIAGSYASRRANVGMGLEDPGMFGDVASIVLPAGQALYGGLKGVDRSMVGTSRPAVAVPERDILGRRGGILTSERGSIQGPAALPWRPFASRDAAPLQPVIDARAASPTMRMAGYTPDLQLRVRLAPGRENTQMLRVEYQSERSRAPLIWANFSREGALLATAPEMAPEELQTFTALAQEAAARLQQTPDWMRPLLGQALYVRFGSLPRGGASQDFARGQRLRGVSVYPARADPLEHVLRFDEAHPHTGEHAFTIGTVLDRPAWLVTGKEVGIGPDNEPLLDAVTPLVRIQYQPQAGGFLPKSGVGTRARRRLQEILTNERGGISLDRLSPRLAAAASMREPVASAVTPARAEAADLPLLAPGAARMALPDLPDRPPAALAPAAAPDLPDSPPQSAYEVDVQVLGPPGTAAAQGLMPAPEPTAPMPWGQIARSAVRTASRGVLGGLPELAIPAVERMTDPTQVPQTAAGVGEMIGQSAGSAVLPGPGTAIGGTVGAVTGLTAGTLATEGRWPTWKEIGREAVWSAVPEIAESTVRGIVRHIGRGTQGGRLIRLDEAARRARDLPGVFQAPPRQQVGQQFDAVRASGLQLDTGIMQQEIQGLRQGKYEDLLAEVRRIDRGHKTGRRYEQLVENLRNPGPGVRVAGWPVGDLQQLRSAVRARAEELTSHEARQLLEDFQGAVDDAIDAGIARGRVPTGMTVADLQEARRQWARVRAHEDLSTLVERTIDVTPDLTMSSFKLKQLANSLRRNEGPLAQRINRALDQTGTRGAFQRDIEEVSQLYQTVELPLADVFGIWRAPGFAVVRQMISGVLASPTGRQIFRDAIIEGRGRLSLNGFAAAVNAARRESGLVFPAIPGLEAERAGATAPTTPGPGG